MHSIVVNIKKTIEESCGSWYCYFNLVAFHLWLSQCPVPIIRSLFFRAQTITIFGNKISRCTFTREECFHSTWYFCLVSVWKIHCKPRTGVQKMLWQQMSIIYWNLMFQFTSFFGHINYHLSKFFFLNLSCIHLPELSLGVCKCF